MLSIECQAPNRPYRGGTGHAGGSRSALPGPKRRRRHRCGTRLPRGTRLRAPRLVESGLGSGLPALAVLCDFSLLGELGQNPVEVVGSNTHLLGHLGNGDARLGLNQGQCLSRAGAAPARTPATAPAGPAPGARASGATTGRTRSTSPTGQLPEHRFELVIFIH